MLRYKTMTDNSIEKEILRINCYYDLINSINIKIKEYFEEPKKIKAIIIRWLLIKIIVRTKEDDELFIKTTSNDLEHQINVDMLYFYSNMFTKEEIKIKSKKIYIYYESLMSRYDKLIKTIETPDDSILQYVNKKFIYKSNKLKSIHDDYVSIKNKTIELYFPYNIINDNKKYVFLSYLRYKYIYIDNQSLMYNYDVLDDGIECFSTPFNKTHKLYCSAFPEIEHHLGSLGEFFNSMRNAITKDFIFPSKRLYINPPFDETYDYHVSKISIEFLDAMETGYVLSFIYPNWTNFKAKDLLLDSKYFYKKEIFKKGELYFTNKFTHKSISPCDIIIMYLKN